MYATRGQLTIFVVIAIVVVVGIGSLFVFSGGPQKTNIPEDGKISVLRDNTLDCMNNLYLDSLALIGTQGGVYPVTDGINNGYFEIPYHYKKGVTLTPLIHEVEESLGRLIDDSIQVCVDYGPLDLEEDVLELSMNRKDFFTEDYSSYTVMYSPSTTDVSIQNNEVIFTTSLDMTITGPDGVHYILALEEYPVTIESDLLAMHAVSVYYTESLNTNDEHICVTCLYDLTEEYGLSVDITEYLQEGDELVVISQNETIPFIFQFLSKYSDNQKGGNLDEIVFEAEE